MNRKELLLEQQALLEKMAQQIEELHKGLLNERKSSKGNKAVSEAKPKSRSKS